jgi:hypothetical protein
MTWTLLLFWFWSGEQPELRLENGTLSISLPVAVLEDEEVQSQIRSGLTTTFRIEINGGATNLVVRVDVRYELWDELFLIDVAGLDGTVFHLQLADESALAEWWSRGFLKIAAFSAGRAPPENLRVTLDILPFSASEQSSAQRWFVDSSRVAAPADDGGGQPISDRPAARDPGLLDLLMATSIKRKPLLRYRWRVPVRQ